VTRFDCEQLRDLAPELALGIADGEDRARALEHLAGCPGCRAHLERISALADELLLCAPAAEPPAGFEERVTAPGAEATRSRRPSWRRFAIPALAAAGAAAAAAAIVWSALGDDRKLADSYRETLAVANGEYFSAAPLEGPGGVRLGYVYGYEGHGRAYSWVFAIVNDGVRDGDYDLVVVTGDGDRESLRSLEIQHGYGSEGAVTPMPYSRIAEVRLLDAHGREVADAEVH
jgi:hypothetical protein